MTSIPHSAPYVAGVALPATLLCGLLALVAVESGIVTPGLWSGRSPDVVLPETVMLAPQPFNYRPAGDYLQGGVDVSAPLVRVTLAAPLVIMTHEVSAADYARCVAASACKAAAPTHNGRGNIPVTGVDYNDAVAYAAWLSGQTGQSWRLPTVEEWDFAAGALARDHGLEALGNAADPSAKWLLDYDQAADEQVPGGAIPKPLGTIGPNEKGVADLGGNVWEWTDTCHARVTLDLEGNVKTTVQTCGIKTIEGRHRMPMSSFIRDAVRGGCSIGIPPDNLGFRLVMDQPWFTGLAKAWRVIWHPRG